MTIDQMRAVLGLDESVSDADVVAAYAAYLLTASPAAEPLTVDEAKAQLGLTDDDTIDEPRIAGLIIAAREYAESYTGLILTAREVVESRDSFGGWVDLYSWPVRSLPTFEYLDSAGSPQTLDVSGYVGSLARRPVRLTAAGEWPAASAAAGAVAITIQAGYASPEQVPQSIKQAMLLLIRAWYDTPTAVISGGSSVGAMEVPLGVSALLDRHRLQVV